MMGTTGSDQPAGLHRRCVAWSIDAALLAPLALLLSWRWTAAAATEWAAQAEALLSHTGRAMGAAVISGVSLQRLADAVLQDPMFAGAVAAIQSASWALLWPFMLAFALLGAVYHASAECSVWRGSIGKRLLGLRVHDQYGQPPGLGRALLRHVASMLSWLTLNLGHAMAAIAPRHLALHDRCSGTRVVTGAGRLPRWATMWLALLAVAAFATVAWIAGKAAEVMRIALEQALY